MANLSPARHAVTSAVAFAPSTKFFHSGTTLLALLLLVAACLTQDQNQSPTPSPVQDPKTAQTTTPPSAETPSANIVIPAGTRLALVLTSPVASKTVHHGNTVYGQMTAPVVVGNAVAIPAGAFVQGKVNKLARNGTRAEMSLDSVSVVFPGGYVANVSGPLNLETDEGTAWKVATKGGLIGAIAAPAAGGAAGALIGHAASSSNGMTLNGLTINPDRMQSTAIGGIVGLGAGSALGLYFLLRSRQFYVDAGSPMELTLPQPLTLAQAQVDDAVRQSQAQPPPITPVAKRPLPPPVDTTPTHTCYTPGTPGTPPTVIPGKPPIGDSPGTPPTVIPGTPAVPGAPYPCK